jgi:hypothetical protein
MWKLVGYERESAEQSGESWEETRLRREGIGVKI